MRKVIAKLLKSLRGILNRPLVPGLVQLFIGVANGLKLIQRQGPMLKIACDALELLDLILPTRIPGLAVDGVLEACEFAASFYRRGAIG